MRISPEISVGTSENFLYIVVPTTLPDATSELILFHCFACGHEVLLVARQA